MPFVHLHNHTDYSLLDGAATIKRYVEKALSCGMKSLAITDHGNMFGAIEFYKACKDAGINPIIGCEFYMTPGSRKDKTLLEDGRRYYHLLLLAMNDEGYHNLIKLSSASYKEGFWNKPRIDTELLEKYNDNLICLSACIAGEIPQALLRGNYERAKERALWFKNVFKDRYYLEVQDHGLAEQKKVNPLIQKLSIELSIPLVCTNDIHYIEKSDSNAHDTLLCIGTGKKKSDEDRLRYEKEQFYFRTPEEMERLFSWCPEAVENTGKIAARCKINIAFPGPELPNFEIPGEYKSDGEYLTFLAKEGLGKRYREVTDSLRERLSYELDVIIKMGFAPYFLIVRDYIHWAKTHDIPVGPGRGSGAGSLVAYAIEITNVDPIKYGLLFERFLNSERISLPDFDIDFCFEGRERVIDYVTEKYGSDKVGQIITFGTLKPKAVVKDVARVLDIPFDEANRITSLIPDEPKITLRKAFETEEKLAEIKNKGGIYEELFNTAELLEGLHRHSSLHAAGIVIGKENLDNYVPLYTDVKTGATATQYSMNELEECGLVKMDFLGLKTLTLIKHTVELIHLKDRDFDIEKIDMEDKKTFDMLSQGDSKCVFQFESAGMSSILKREEPRTIEELVALNALYRPGPMDHIGEYIDAKQGRKKIKYPDPVLEDVLKETYGVIIYQEQVMKVAELIAGYTLGQADILRRIMGKKKESLLPPELKKFKEGAIKNGYTSEHAEEIFNLLVPFAHYGFNKSHAVAYSILAYQTAYLKANYISEFLAANLTNEMNNADKFSEYLNLAPGYGIKILPPSINKSTKFFTVNGKDIVYGLVGIKNVGEAPIDAIIKEREENGPYTSFMEFLSRQKDGCLNMKVLESLILTGVFDELGTDNATLMLNLEEAVKFDRAEKESRAYGQLSFFDDEESFKSEFKMKSAAPFSLSDKLSKEKELLGFYISGHPLNEYEKEIAECVRVNLAKKNEIPLNVRTNLIALITAERLLLTRKKQERMASYVLQTKEGTVEAVAFPEVFSKIRDKVRKDEVFGFTGTFVSRDSSPLSYIIESVVAPKELQPDSISRLNIELISSSDIDTQIEKVLSCVKAHPGTIPVFFSFSNKPGEMLKADYNYEIDYSASLKDELNNIDIVSKVWIS